MNLKTARATTGIGTGVMVALAAAGWVFLVGPATGQIGETQTQIEDAQASNQLLSVQLTGLQAQADDLSATSEAARRLARRFPATADQPGFFSAVSQAATAAGYRPDSLTALSPAAPVPVAAAGAEAIDPNDTAAVEAAAEAAPYFYQMVTLTADGTYAQAQALLDGIEQMDRSVLVQSVSLTAGEGDVMTLSVNGATFVAPPVKKPEADDARGADPEASEAATTASP